MHHLKDRRERLKRLALDHLSLSESIRLGLHGSAVLDTHAPEVMGLLVRRGVSIPEALVLGENVLSVHHGFGFDKRDADRLFSLGFGDVDQFKDLVFNLEVPLTSRFYGFDADRFVWLFEHGTSVSQKLAQSSRGASLQPFEAVTTGHFAFYQLGDRLRHISKKDIDNSRALFRMVLPAVLSDNCRCKCSPEGCTPLIYLLKGIARHDKTDKSFCLLYIQEIGCTSNWAIEHHITAMRFLTFEALEIRHTCCFPSVLPVGGHAVVDLDEFDDDDDVVLDAFHRLFGVFQHDLRNRAANMISWPASLVQFWNEVWPARLAAEKEALAAIGMSDVEMKRAEELGVVWEEEPEVQGCETIPDPSPNPYDMNQIEYWYHELDSIAPEY
jgi:hypothetical protein